MKTLKDYPINKMQDNYKNFPKDMEDYLFLKNNWKRKNSTKAARMYNLKCHLDNVKSHKRLIQIQKDLDYLLQSMAKLRGKKEDIAELLEAKVHLSWRLLEVA